MGGKLGTSLASVGNIGHHSTHSTNSQSNSAGDAFKIMDPDFVANTITDVIRQVGYELKVGGWTVSRISKNQAALGDNDWFYLHGYILLELTREKEQVEGCNETGDEGDEAGGAVFDEEKYYCRIDWGSDGLYVQLHEDVEKLVLYEKKIEEWAEESRAKALSAVATGLGVSAAGLGSVSGYAWLYGVTASACPWALAAGAVVYFVGGGLAVSATGAYVDHKLGVMGHNFRKVNPRYSNDRVMKFLQLELENKKEYSIEENNCNHFSKRMFNFVLNGS